MTSLSGIFAALSDDTRRAVLHQLKGGEAKVSNLASSFDMTLTGVSNHLQTLKNAGLIEIEKRGRTRYCRLKPHTLRLASNWFDDYEAFWDHQLDRIEDALTADKDPR